MNTCIISSFGFLFLFTACLAEIGTPPNFGGPSHSGQDAQAGSQGGPPAQSGQPGYPGKPVGGQLTGRPCNMVVTVGVVPAALTGVCNPGKVDGNVCCQTVTVAGLVNIVQNCPRPQYCCVAKVAAGVLLNFATVAC